MSDSVDRVFSHALNTVNKIRTGSQKPPSATRLKLYGLYKQAMEGDVDGIMDRPEGSGEDVKRAREKWDAWKQQNGLSRTEAKRRYITTLIDTMHRYASPSPDSRELVAELEFVWDQVKSNVPSSSSSSPIQKFAPVGLHMSPGYPRLGISKEDPDDRDPRSLASHPEEDEEEELEDEREEQGDEFVDAPDSQYNPNSDPDDEDAGVQTDLAIQAPVPYSTAATKPSVPPSPATPGEQRWRKRVEQALVKMTAEVAALREQLESRRLFSYSRRYTVFRWVFRTLWATLKHMAIDVVVLGLVLLWMRRREDRRLEGAVRVLLGDAVAQVQKVGGAQMGRIQLPGMKAKK